MAQRATVTDPPKKLSAQTSAYLGDDFIDPPPAYDFQPHNRDVAEMEASPSRAPADERPIIVAIMGPTGTGKSTFISKVAGRQMNIGHHLSSCTQEVEEVPCKIGDRFVILVDTPGFNDTERSDNDILRDLAEWMKEKYDENMLLSGIIYLHSISDARMTKSSLQNLRMFRKLCGEDNLGNVILTTTKWGTTPIEQAVLREKDLTSEGGFWSTMIAAGSRVRRFENSASSAEALVNEVLRGQQRFVPAIQEEIAKGKKLVDTDAGAYLNKEIERLHKQYREEQEVIKEELERARKRQDERMREVLIFEQQRLDKKIAEKEEEQRNLHMDTIEALMQRVKNLEQGGTWKPQQKPSLSVKLGFWRSNWKCKKCKVKTGNSGVWTCPNCEFVQENLR